MKKGVLRNFTKFTSFGAAALFKKWLWHSCFPVNFEKFLRTPLLQNTSGRLLLYLWKKVYYKMHRNFITKRGKNVLQNAAAFLLQNASILLQNAAGITKRNITASTNFKNTSPSEGLDLFCIIRNFTIIEAELTIECQ